jgi:beta-phosphoglucomutase-like phosphatase (HAD superfamily)
MATIKHLLFDNDGTIVDSEIIAVRIILRMLAPLGFQMQEEEYCQRFPGLLTRDILVILKDEYGLRLPDNFIHTLHTEHERLFDSELRVVPASLRIVFIWFFGVY